MFLVLILSLAHWNLWYFFVLFCFVKQIDQLTKKKKKSLHIHNHATTFQAKREQFFLQFFLSHDCNQVLNYVHLTLDSLLIRIFGWACALFFPFISYQHRSSSHFLSYFRTYQSKQPKPIDKTKNAAYSVLRIISA